MGALQVRPGELLNWPARRRAESGFWKRFEKLKFAFESELFGRRR